MIPADAAAAVSVLIKAVGYGATLVAAGAPLFLLAHPLPAAEARQTRRLAVAAAAVALIAAGAALAARASFLGGGGLAMALDPVLLGVVIDSPAGDAAAVRAIGLALVATLIFGEAALVLAAVGGALAAGGFAQVGHTLEGPRALLGVLLTAHLLGVAYWMAALVPLRRMAGRGAEGGAVAEAFGRNAVWVVGGLALAGATLALLLVGDPLAAIVTPYGAALAVKLALVAGLLGLASVNKLRLSPALAAGAPGARLRLQRAIDAEIALVVLILLTTAALTTTAGSPN